MDWGSELAVSLARIAAVVIITGAITVVPRWLGLRSKPARLADGGGRITPGKISAVVVVILGLLFSAAGCVGIWSGDLALGSFILATGAALALFMAPSLTHWHDVIWTDTMIEGPSRMFGPTLGLARIRIRWNEIARTGGTVTGYSFVETSDRRRVYWSYLYRGFAVFEERLKLHRPDLFGDAAAEGRLRTTVSGFDDAHSVPPARPVIGADTGPTGDCDGPRDPGDGAA